MSVELAAWLGTATVAVAATVVSTLPRSSPVVRSVPAVAVMAVVVCSGIFHLRPPAPSSWIASVTALTIARLGVVAGSAVTNAALSLAMRPAELEGPHGGIVVAPESIADDGAGDEVGSAPSDSATTVHPTTRPSTEPSEVLRGGAAIGYLERSALIGAALVGRLEVLAVVIAVKGLGRFTELDTAEARERFIIGTLASTLWAGCTAVAVLLP